MTNKFVDECIEVAELPFYDEVLSELEGMSSMRNRVLLNLLCKDKKYLEVGTNKGSTLISACYKNGATGLAYDDYRRFGHHEAYVNKLINKYKVDARLIVADGMTHKEGKFDVIHYDGDHAYESCYDALEYFKDFLNKDGIFIVDDLNYEPTKQAVLTFVKDYKVRKTWYLFAEKSNGINKFDLDGWFNGVAILKL